MPTSAHSSGSSGSAGSPGSAGSAGSPGSTARKWRTALVVGAPLVSIATFMIGLRIGAGHAVRAASIFVAPPGTPVKTGAPAPLAWQILTYLEDRGVRETVAMKDLRVTVRNGGRESTWTGSSNTDGIAEARLELAEPTTNAVEIEVRAGEEREALASGIVEWKRGSWGAAHEAIGEHAAVRPSLREGDIGIDVYVEGQRLVAGFETPIWAHFDGVNEHVDVRLEPEAGLRLAHDDAPVRDPLGCRGWTRIGGIAEGHVAGLRIDAKAHGKQGVWFSALRVAPGAFFADMPRFFPTDAVAPVTLVAPNPRTVVYAEIDDERGRVFAAALPVTSTSDDPVPRARLEMPPLAPGLHWLVVSGEPRGAEHLGGATIARPFLVGSASGSDPDGVRPKEECSIGPWLAQHPASGFPRQLALDGMATRGAANRARHRLGLFIGLGSLLTAAVLEVLLLSAAAREARALSAELENESEDGAAMTTQTRGGANTPGLLIALLVAIMGFALLAVLLITKG